MDEDEVVEKYLIGLTRILRDYLINNTLTKEEVKKIVSLPPAEFIDFVGKYEGDKS